MKLFRAILWIALSASAALCQQVNLTQSDGHIDVTIDGKPFTTYYVSPVTQKAYLMPLRTAGGTIVTRGFPVVNDVSAGSPKDQAFEPHQRPLYWGHGNINGFDFWGEQTFDRLYTDHARQPYGRMVLKSVEEVRSGSPTGTVRASFDLIGGTDLPVASEIQEFTFSGTADTRVIDVQITIQAAYGPVTFGDTKEGTFAIRLAKELSGTHARMTNSDGAQGEKNLWGKKANWVDYSGVIDGEPLGIAIFDGNQNLRHPETWHARAYGLFAVNPFGLREFSRDGMQDGSWTVPEGKSITFSYRVLLHHGQIGDFNVAAAYEQFAKR
jgi:Methane oxygenase PmoA